MTATPWLVILCILVAFRYSMRFGTEMIQRRTGRESRPGNSPNGYDAVFVGLTLGISMSPFYFLPDADPLVYSGSVILGLLVGPLVSQALFGRKVA